MGLDLLSRFRKQSADDPPTTESWPLFAFGKLPVYKDFISAGLTDDASREFRDWLSNGFSRLWSARDDCRSTEIPLHAFLLGLPESRKMAVGALWGSKDQGGLRKFPFALFTILPAGKPVASVLSALDYLPVFETRAREIRRKYEAGGALADVYQELRGARIEVPVRPQKQIRARLAEALARDRVGPLAIALFGADAAVRWPALLTGLDAAARHPVAGAAALRVPLAEGSGPLDQLKLWTERLAKASSVAPTGVLYRMGAAAPCGVLFFRDARAEDVFLFHPAAIPTDFVEEIPKSRGPAAAETASEPAQALKRFTLEPDVPLPPEPGPPVSPTHPAALETALPPEAAPPAAAPAAGEILLLGAAARTAETQPASLLSAPPPEAAPESPAVSGSVPAAEPPPAPELPAVSESPTVVEQPRVPEQRAAPTEAAPAAAGVSPTPPLPPGPPPRPEPAGWDLPLSSLLEAG